MSNHSRRWFQMSLKSLFLLVLLVATFFADYTLATKQAEAERQQAELEAQRALEEARLHAETQALQPRLVQPPVGVPLPGPLPPPGEHWPKLGEGEEWISE
jgi:hypothetical protein